MEVAAGAMTPLLRKLGDLLADEFSLEKRVRKGIKSLLTELEMMHAVLRKVGNIPPDQLDESVRIWAGKVKELSYNMEDSVDGSFVIFEDGRERGPTRSMKKKVKKFLKKTTKLFSKGKALHQISGAIEEAQELAKELGELRQRYMLEAHANSMADTVHPLLREHAGSTRDTIDPRLKAIYKDVTELVGIDHTRDELIKKMSSGNEGSKKQLKTISIVGFGGLGKTTLAKSVYDKIRMKFDCGAFVSVSQNPDTKKIFKKILHQLDKNKFAAINEAIRDEEQLIDELKMFLQDKRYLIIIDDIWDVKAWEVIKCAFSKNNRGSQLMTTTRIMMVARACCCCSDDILYEMKPLSGIDSQSLFYKTIFCHENGCPLELEQVSTAILKKCGGVPLAIITIGSLLASDQHVKPKDQWLALLKSIGRGLTEDPSLDEMQRILSFSYYNLPSHLKTCLLYLSAFPEDCEIDRGPLIWRWIAEGFVQSVKQETSLYEVGERYFNELINRNLIQPIHIDDQGIAAACRVHDMVLDLICSLSSEENFVTVLHGTEGSTTSSRSKVRRLAFHNSMPELTTPHVDTTNMSQVRSVILYRTVGDLIKSLPSFQFLRVLDLEGCYLGENSLKTHLRNVGNLLRLRYLGLRNTKVRGLPMKIGRLQFLETLDLRGNHLVVPSSIVLLGRLMCLNVSGGTRMPIGMDNLVCLEELSEVCVDGSHALVKELSHLIKLRVLRLLLHESIKSTCKSLVESLGNLLKLQHLSIRNEDCTRFDGCWDSWVPPRHLHALWFHKCTSRLPKCIDSSSLPLLQFIHIVVDQVRQGEDIEILGKLPALRTLLLEATEYQHTFVQKPIISAGAFPYLINCVFYNFEMSPSSFPRGALPMLETLGFCAPASDIASGELDVGMEHLPSLQQVRVTLLPETGVTIWSEEAHEALKIAAYANPNRPTVSIYVHN